MTEHETQLLYCYLIHRQGALEDELQEIQSHIRYRRVDSCDCLELAVAIERLQAFREFSADVVALLKLNERKNRGH